MKNRYIATQWLALFLLLLTNCSDEKTFSSQEGGRYQSKLMFNVVQTVTRAGEAADDVKRADILLFKEGKLEKRMLNITSFNTTSEGYTSVEISFDTQGIRQAYVVANIDDASWLESLELGVTTLEDIKAFQTAHLAKMSNPPFVMYGISEDISFGEMANSTLCPLYRAVARIDVNNKATDFTLHSARLLRSKAASTIFPGTAMSDSKLTDFEGIEAVDNSVRLYSYENTSTDLEHATAVEVSGEVNGVELIYTVPFMVDKKPIPLQRNYQYTINVNNVQANELNTSITVRPWKLGDDISNIVSGNQPMVEVLIDPAVGTYTAADSSFVVGAVGGRITFDVKANADCAIRFTGITGDWMFPVAETRAPSFIAGRLVMEVAPNSELMPRNGTIVIYNKLSGASRTFSLKQAEGDSQENKFMVLVVAGQSNASGYDDSGFDSQDTTAPRVFQLSYGLRGARNLDIIPLTADADDIDDYILGDNRVLKGIHLPLAKELLKQLPDNTKILVVPVSVTGTGFQKIREVGAYDAIGKKPDVAQNSKVQTRWASEGAYYRTLVDRTKYALELNAANKLLGVVWCQGEHDRRLADEHYLAFTDMTAHFFSELNGAGLGARTNFGTLDKRSWYVYSSTSLFMNWYSTESDATTVFSSYKQWNPDGFIHVPFNTPVNPEGGRGQGANHFGQSSYRTIIAPAVAQCMNNNGSLFNGVSPQFNRFNPTVTSSEANAEGGSLADADIQANLLMYMPFTATAYEKVGTGNIAPINISMGNASGLQGIGGASRTRQAAKFTKTSRLLFSKGTASVNQWSVSFMLKRTGGLGNATQTVLANGSSTTPFIGFKYYAKAQHTAGITEFSVEPSFQSANMWLKAVPGQLLNADRVRSLDQWIHYVVTYNNNTKQCIIYMNGEEVQRATLTGLGNSNITNYSLGYVSDELPGFEGDFMEFFCWGRVITPATVKKLYLMGYYGYTK